MDENTVVAVDNAYKCISAVFAVGMNVAHLRQVLAHCFATK